MPKSPSSIIPIFLAAIVLLAVTTPARSHDIITTNLTYTRDISRIIDQRCAGCHSSGSSIPLTTYDQVRPWAVAIKEQVLARTMPPWGAVKGFGYLRGDRSLTQEEIMIVAAWVIGGAPQGDPALAPKQGHGRPATAPPTLKDALTIEQKTTLKSPLRLSAIRPVSQGVIASARIVAKMPSGEIEPLVWLYGCDPKWKQTFYLREPLDLPRGAVLESSTPLRFVLQTP